jgi:FkbM family methyltransferase
MPSSADDIARASNAAVRWSGLLHGYGIPAHVVGKLLGPRMTETMVRHRTGYWIEVDPAEYCGEVVALCGDYDGRIGEIVGKLAGPGAVVVDVGALYGTEALRAARAVGPKGRVHVFEPQRKFADGIRRTMERNHLKWVTVHQVALGDRDELVTLTPPPIEFGARNHGDVTIASGGTGERVHLVDAGPYFAENGIDEVDVIKIDVQGQEASVLRSVLTGISRQPRAIVLESMHRGLSIGDREEMQLLAEFGYEIGEVQTSMIRLKVRQVMPRHVPTHRHIDFVAIHKSVPAWVRRQVGWISG